MALTAFHTVDYFKTICGDDIVQKWHTTRFEGEDDPQDPRFVLREPLLLKTSPRETTRRTIVFYLSYRFRLQVGQRVSFPFVSH